MLGRLESYLYTFAISTLIGLLIGGYIAKMGSDSKIAKMQQEYAELKQISQETALLRERSIYATAHKATQQYQVRERKAAADAVLARDELRLLHEASGAFLGAAEASAATSELRASVYHDLLGRCAKEYLGMAEKADRADNAARTLIEAWPK